ncbi:hypothetical protein KIN20_035135 [Parelaphostrongylus tenuis]|uniref:Uncharacterized protein n=1 Tax=Parelaphostrongylus tenuis TaxID=148309 RepID=A0AAD5RBC1_PARTN|nr:hypothetical protein KIN20_035135 [Parelaphostrongylus tenuis]
MVAVSKSPLAFVLGKSYEKALLTKNLTGTCGGGSAVFAVWSLCAARVELPGCDDFCPLKWLVALPSCYGLNFGLCDRVFCQLVSCNRQEHKVQILYMGYTKQCDETEQ